jgi:hypothetical protein
MTDIFPVRLPVSESFSEANASAKISEMRADGVVFAATEEGYVLPVIDVTNSRFAMPSDPAMVRAQQAVFLANEKRLRWTPRFILRMILRSAAKRSRLVRAMFGSDAAFLDGITTYVMKLGAENLVPPYDTPTDRKFASAPHVALLRLRLQQTASLLAEGLASDLTGRDGALHLINIGGGPALDSINALILLRRSQPELLQRPTVIHVLDPDTAGPSFGAKALAALMADDGPLNGLDIAFDHRPYNWDQPSDLETLVRDLEPGAAVIAVSSEGALFEYGTDQAIIANLNALRMSEKVRLVAGSVTSADKARKRMIANSRFKLYPRGAGGLSPLAARSGFTIARIESAPLSDQVLLRPSS